MATNEYNRIINEKYSQQEQIEEKLKKKINKTSYL